MRYLEIDHRSKNSITKSFDHIANRLFNDCQLQVNQSYYRLLDIEFYYFAPGVYEGVYAHKHEAQLQNGKWYFHGSGIDITICNGQYSGGILLRGVAKLFGEAPPEKNFIQKEIHGPINVKTEICSNLHGVFDDEANVFQLHDISRDRMMAGMRMPRFVIKTKRVGLNPDVDSSQDFYQGKLRYVIFPHLKLRDKAQIAMDMQAQFPEMSKEEINKELGSTFLR